MGNVERVRKIAAETMLKSVELLSVSVQPLPARCTDCAVLPVFAVLVVSTIFGLGLPP